MNIVCLGCSYTAGMPDDFFSWPEALSQIRKDDIIYNLAVGGSSLLFSIYLLEEISKIIHIDKVIFQRTLPHRFTSVKDLHLNENLLKKSSNYYRLDPNIRSKRNLLTITPADVLPKWSKFYEKINFAKQYYKFYSNQLGDLEHSILTNLAKEKSNFSFEHADVPAEAKLNIIDSAGHFSKQGHNVIADWINNELERNIY